MSKRALKKLLKRRKYVTYPLKSSPKKWLLISTLIIGLLFAFGFSLRFYSPDDNLSTLSYLLIILFAGFLIATEWDKELFRPLHLFRIGSSIIFGSLFGYIKSISIVDTLGIIIIFMIVALLTKFWTKLFSQPYI